MVQWRVSNEKKLKRWLNTCDFFSCISRATNNFSFLLCSSQAKKLIPRFCRAANPKASSQTRSPLSGVPGSAGRRQILVLVLRRENNSGLGGGKRESKRESGCVCETAVKAKTTSKEAHRSPPFPKSRSSSEARRLVFSPTRPQLELVPYDPPATLRACSAQEYLLNNLVV